MLKGLEDDKVKGFKPEQQEVRHSPDFASVLCLTSIKLILLLDVMLEP